MKTSYKQSANIAQRTSAASNLVRGMNLIAGVMKTHGSVNVVQRHSKLRKDYSHTNKCMIQILQLGLNAGIVKMIIKV